MKIIIYIIATIIHNVVMYIGIRREGDRDWGPSKIPSTLLYDEATHTISYRKTVLGHGPGHSPFASRRNVNT